MKPVRETHEKVINYTVMVPVKEECTREVVRVVCTPVNYTKTIQVRGGHWETRTEEVPGPVVRRVVREPGTWVWDECRCKCVTAGRLPR